MAAFLPAISGGSPSSLRQSPSPPTTSSFLDLLHGTWAGSSSTPGPVRAHAGQVGLAALAFAVGGCCQARLRRSSGASKPWSWRWQRSQRGGCVVSLSAVSDTLAELQTLKTKDLRERLQAAGYNVADRFDKESLLELIKTQPEDVIREVATMRESRTTLAPVKDSGGYLSMEIKMGERRTPGRFRFDMTVPFTMIDPRWAQSLNATVTPTCQSGQRSLGKSSIGDLEIGEFLATPFTTENPPDCCGVLGIDFMRKFDWDFNLPRNQVRIATIPPVGNVPVPFDVDGLREHILADQPCAVSGVQMRMPWLPATMLRPKYVTEYVTDLPYVRETFAWFTSQAVYNQPSVDVKGLLDFGPIMTMKTGTTTQLQVRDMVDIDDDQIVSITDLQQGPKKNRMRLAKLECRLGEGEEAKAGESKAVDVVLDHPRLQRLQLPPGRPVVLLGLEGLRKFRLVLSLRLRKSYSP